MQPRRVCSCDIPSDLATGDDKRVIVLLLTSLHETSKNHSVMWNLLSVTHTISKQFRKATCSIQISQFEKWTGLEGATSNTSLWCQTHFLLPSMSYSENFRETSSEVQLLQYSRNGWGSIVFTHTALAILLWAFVNVRGQFFHIRSSNHTAWTLF